MYPAGGCAAVPGIRISRKTRGADATSRGSRADRNRSPYCWTVGPASAPAAPVSMGRTIGPASAVGDVPTWRSARHLISGDRPPTERACPWSRRSPRAFRCERWRADSDCRTLSRRSSVLSRVLPYALRSVEPPPNGQGSGCSIRFARLELERMVSNGWCRTAG